jgi:hypothetical protein
LALNIKTIRQWQSSVEHRYPDELGRGLHQVELQTAKHNLVDHLDKKVYNILKMVFP